MEHDQHLGDSVEDRRRRVLEAATACLRKEEEEELWHIGARVKGDFMKLISAQNRVVRLQPLPALGPVQCPWYHYSSC